MANYYGMARTNYFAVKDAQAFLAEIENIPDLQLDGNSDPQSVCILSESESGWVWSYYDEETGEDTEVDWEGIFTRCLADGSVAIIMEIGNEKLRYLSGIAVAYNNKGETRDVSLDNIYTLAEELGENITRATY
jgi:hypothetical protein